MELVIMWGTAEEAYQSADLVIEREVGDIDWAGWAKFGRGWPKNFPIMTHHGPARHVALSVVIRTALNRLFEQWLYSDASQSQHHVTINPIINILSSLFSGIA